uniref:PHD-type domain-containing protein n=1 Tax=Tetradesmus obliquus TaxID=3088 RepID=A0A383V1K2_TETOB|eukprot:jgi/Sobl393_1/2938/SZX59428.1
MACMHTQPAQRIFEPPKVPVFCVCEMPYNPDKFMVQCDQCTEWYHPECLKTSRKALKSQSNWRCPECVRIAQLAAGAGTAAAGHVAAAAARDGVDAKAQQHGKQDKRRKTAD